MNNFKRLLAAFASGFGLALALYATAYLFQAAHAHDAGHQARNYQELTKKQSAVIAECRFQYSSYWRRAECYLELWKMMI